MRQLPWARLCLACMSAVDSCWVLTPSERAAAANAGDDVSAWPAANSGWSAALTRAVLTCSSPATAATIASWPGFSLADMVFAGAPGLAPVSDATAAVLPAARAAVTAAAAIILVRLRMRILLGFVACTQGNQAGLRRAEEVPYRGLRSSAVPVAAGPWSPVTGASALRMSRREMLGERQVAAPLMAQRAAHGALRLAHRRFQPGEGVGIQLAGLRLSWKPQRPSQCQFGHETLVLAFALFAPAASRPGQHYAVWRQRGRQAAPCGHASTVGQRFLRLVLRDDPEERRRTSSSALAGRTLSVRVAARVTAISRLAVVMDSFGSRRWSRAAFSDHLSGTLAFRSRQGRPD